MVRIQDLRRRAERGPAAYELACRLNRGEGVAPDHDQAERWLTIAIERGNRHALLARFEEFLESDLVRAVEFGERIVAQGPSNAARDAALQLVFGLVHDFDPDKSRLKRGPDPRRGVAWLRRLARQDDVRAIQYLANILDRPRPFRRNAHEAFDWAQRGAELGDPHTLVELGANAHNGEFGRRNYRRAIECYRLAARHGSAHAVLNLGRSFMAGHGVPKDSERGVQYFRDALRRGERDAELALAKALWKGEGARRDRKRAWRLATRCARRGLEEAAVWRGAVLTEEERDPRAQRRGVRILEHLVERGSSMAMNDLAAHLHEFDPREGHLPRAIGLYIRAVYLGNEVAMENLARCYLSGHPGVLARMPSAARALLKRSSLLGNSDARNALRHLSRSPRSLGCGEPTGSERD
jgi:uncharacterized protein